MIIRRKNILFTLRVMLLILFAGYYSNISMFYHSHLVDGRVITHSHWFDDFDNKKPVNSHSHTSQEYIHIHLLNYSSMDNDLIVPALNAPVIIPVRITSIPIIRYISSEKFTYFQLRAPPV